jgi:hypothetical protein
MGTEKSTRGKSLEVTIKTEAKEEKYKHTHRSLNM